MTSPLSPDWDALIGGFDINFPAITPADEQLIYFPNFTETLLQADIMNAGSVYQGQSSSRGIPQAFRADGPVSGTWDTNYAPLVDLRGPYGNSNSNIFMRMQELDEEQSKRRQQIQIFRPLPAPDDMTLPREDSVWLEYFHKLALSWDNNSIPRFVPGLLHRMYSLSLNHYALRQALMGQAAGYYAILNTSSLENSRRFVAQLLPSVQTAISKLTFDEGHLCAVFQLIKIYAQLGDIMGAHRHLQGLRLMIDHLLSARKAPHPLVMCIYRGSIMFDIWFAFEGIPFALSSPEGNKDSVHRKWLEEFIPASQPHLIEIVLAQFELDDLEHRVMTLLQHRQSTDFDPETDEIKIKTQGAEILAALEAWMRRPIVEQCQAEEIMARRGVSTVGQGKFLHYPPLIFRNEQYALLLISYHSLVILATMLTHPEIGPQPYVRFTSAITLCRILAFNMQRTKNEGKPDPVHWHTHDLMRVGLVLGEPIYPLGTPIQTWLRTNQCRIPVDYGETEGEKVSDCTPNCG